MMNKWRDEFTSSRIFIHILFLVVTLGTIHTWFWAGTLPIEADDECAHTLVEIPLFFRELLHGRLLNMNLFNGFGTPLIGDAVFNPWAPHSLTYFFLPGYMGLLANKALITFLTLEILYFYGMKMGVSRKFAVWFALMTATNPAFLFFVNHHPHLGAVFYFTFMLLMFERLLEKFTPARLFCLSFSYLILLVGVGINGIAIAHIFLPIYFIVAYKKLTPKQWMITGMALAGALAIYLPHFLAFMEWGPLTVRASKTIFDFPGRGNYERPELLLVGLSIFIFLTKFHLDYTVLQTLILPLLILLTAAMTVYRPALWKRNPRVGWNFLFGSLMTALVYLLLVRLDWLEEVPLFKSSDVTRFFWFSMIFVNLGAAYALEVFFEARRPWPVWIALAPVVGAFTYVAVLYLELQKQTAEYLDPDFWILLFTGFALIAFVLQMIFRFPQKWSGVMLALTVLPRAVAVLGFASMYQNTPDQFGIVPRGIEKLIPPFNRMAAVYETHDAPDQRLAVHSILGSNVRSIVASRELKEYLQHFNLIDADLYKYQFTRQAVDHMDFTGISYVLAKDQPLRAEKWTYVDTISGYENPYYLYRRTDPVTPVYCRSGASILGFQKPDFVGNEIRVVADQDCPILTGAFYSWPGWFVKIGDQAATQVDHSEIFLTARGVKRGDEVKFYFDPWPAHFWLAFAAVGFIAMSLSLVLTRRET